LGEVRLVCGFARLSACKGVTPFPLALRGRAGIGFEANGTWDGVRTWFEANGTWDGVRTRFKARSGHGIHLLSQ